jgi:hypothetical protein
VRVAQCMHHCGVFLRLKDVAIAHVDNAVSIKGLCNVDQFCRNISSIIVFSGLPRLERWAAPAVVEAQ